MNGLSLICQVEKQIVLSSMHVICGDVNIVAQYSIQCTWNPYTGNLPPAN